MRGSTGDRWGRPAATGCRSSRDSLAAMATPFPPLDGSAPKHAAVQRSRPRWASTRRSATRRRWTRRSARSSSPSTPINAPKTVNNFVFLAAHHYYDGIIFHRIINGFMCQGGDPTGTGRGGPGYRFEDEPVKQRYQIGSVAMANAGPNTNGSQFFLISGPSGVSLPPQYNHFGQIVKGLDVLDAMQTRRHRSQRPPARGRRHQLGHHHRCRLTSAAASMATRSRSPRGPAHRARRAGLRRAAPVGPRRPPPPAPGARPHGPDPDRLGQRARAQPGAAAVRPPRAAPAHADRRRHRRRRAVRVLGARGVASCPTDAPPPLPLEDGQRAPVGSAASTADEERRPGYIEEVLRAGRRRRARSSPATSPQRVGKKGTWWDWDDGKIALEHLFWTRPGRRRGAGRATSPACTTCTERLIPAARRWPDPRRPSTTRARSCSSWPPGTTASPRSTT